METLLNDIRYGIRGLLKRPGFTAVATITLALGIGANTAIFSVVNALLLRPPSGVEHSEQLVLATWDSSGLGPSYPDYIDFRDRSTAFTGLAIFGPTTLNLGAAGEPERITGAVVSGNYFPVLRAQAARGRTLLPEDDTAPGANPVAVVSDGLWRRRFNADQNLVGRTIRLNGSPFTVVGIALPQFTGLETGRTTDIWVPISMAAQADPTLAEAPKTRVARGWLKAFGRLKPSVSLEQAQREMSAVARSLEETFPETNKGVGIKLVANLGLGPKQRTEALDFAGLLAAVAGLVLLIACANVANLMLARGQARRKEIGIRLALGASRFRLIRQLLTESLLLAMTGGVLGLILAFWLSGPLKNFLSFGQGHYSALNVAPDMRVLVFTLFVAVVTGLLFGLIPALQAARTDVTPVLKNAPRNVGGGNRRIKLSGLLVIGQIALSLVVLIAAGLFVRTLQKAQAVSPGFNADQVVTASLDVGKQGYSESQGRQFYRQLLERLDRLSAVRSASLALTAPLGEKTWNTRVRAEGQPSDAAPLQVDYNVVSPHYFSTLEIPFNSGRDFNTTDEEQAPGVVIINETLARKLFPGENPIGKRVIRFIRGEPKFSLEVVGIVKDSKYQQLTEQSRAQLYFPLLQQYRSTMTLQVRSERPPGELLAAVRREAQALDANLPLFDSSLLAEKLEASVSSQRSTVALIGAFGLLALALASIGLYGVMAHNVSQHTREMGIRMALGAQKGDVVKMIIKQGMLLAISGVVIGLISALALTRLTKALLFGVTPTDPLTFTVVALLLSGVALLACYVPARRATKVDPLVALRYE